MEKRNVGALPTLSLVARHSCHNDESQAPSGFSSSMQQGASDPPSGERKEYDGVYTTHNVLRLDSIPYVNVIFLRRIYKSRPTSPFCHNYKPPVMPDNLSFRSKQPGWCEAVCTLLLFHYDGCFVFEYVRHAPDPSWR